MRGRVGFGLMMLLANAAFLVGCGATTPTGCDGADAGVGPSAACTHGPSAGPGSLPQAVAVDRARALAPSANGETVVVWASLEPDPFIRSDAPDAPQVWKVRLEGGLTAPSCPPGFLDQPATPGDPPCLDDAGGLVVAIDATTGVLVGFTH